KKLKLTDPNAPRRATNAFMFYANLAREELKRERQQKINDGVELDEANLTKALGAKWRSLDNEERKYYQELFRKDVERYQRELDEY
ncbi:high mobility group box domain-containing protein, partial [Polychytrium aggregatum]|uniref:high mobility group box domain-containing protein n=1 Tax=Polychytrium aggregatum TaxID=110093 RepID=UPI0022FF0837